MHPLLASSMRSIHFSNADALSGLRSSCIFDGDDGDDVDDVDCGDCGDGGDGDLDSDDGGDSDDGCPSPFRLKLTAFVLSASAVL